MPRPFHRPIVAWLTLTAAALIGLSPPSARADVDPPGRVARVAEVSGSVRTIDDDGAWVPLPPNRPLTTGDRVDTGADGGALLQIGSTCLTLGASSSLTITRLDDQVVRLRFAKGLLDVRLRSAAVVGEIGIETDEGLWVPRHPGGFRFERGADRVLAAQVTAGDLQLQAADSTLPLAAGQRAQVWQEGPQQTTHYRRVAPVRDAFGDRTQAQDWREAQDFTGGASPVPAEMTGAAELARLGRWSRRADGSAAWTPARVPAGWAPYRDGSWHWIRPWGWTWIDAARWGFAPCHYGRWTFEQGRWSWVPGPSGPRPTYAPALVGWLGGAGFALGGRAAVGWVALAPGESFFPGYPVSAAGWRRLNGAGPMPGNGRPSNAVRARIEPSGAGVYANRAVAGAVSIVPLADLAAPHARPTLPPQDRAQARRLLEQAVQGRVQALPPPRPPAGRGPLGEAPADGGAGA